MLQHLKSEIASSWMVFHPIVAFFPLFVDIYGDDVPDLSVRGTEIK